MKRNIFRLKKAATAVAFTVMSMGAIAAPMNSYVAKGTVNINQIGSDTNVTLESTGPAMINWGSFNVDAGETVNFARTNGAGNLIVNIDQQGAASQIAGTINTDGVKALLVNEHGMTIKNTAVLGAEFAAITAKNNTVTVDASGLVSLEPVDGSIVIEEGFISNAGYESIAVVPTLDPNSNQYSLNGLGHIAYDLNEYDLNGKTVNLHLDAEVSYLNDLTDAIFNLQGDNTLTFIQSYIDANGNKQFVGSRLTNVIINGLQEKALKASVLSADNISVSGFEHIDFNGEEYVTNSEFVAPSIKLWDFGLESNADITNNTFVNPEGKTYIQEVFGAEQDLTGILVYDGGLIQGNSFVSEGKISIVSMNNDILSNEVLGGNGEVKILGYLISNNNINSTGNVSISSTNALQGEGIVVNDNVINSNEIELNNLISATNNELTSNNIHFIALNSGDIESLNNAIEAQLVAPTGMQYEMNDSGVFVLVEAPVEVLPEVPAPAEEPGQENPVVATPTMPSEETPVDEYYDDRYDILVDVDPVTIRKIDEMVKGEDKVLIEVSAPRFEISSPVLLMKDSNSIKVDLNHPKEKQKKDDSAA